MLYRNVDYYCHTSHSMMALHKPRWYKGMLTITATYLFQGQGFLTTTQMIYNNVYYYCNISLSGMPYHQPRWYILMLTITATCIFSNASIPTQMLYRNDDYYCHISLSAMPQHLPKCYIGMLTVTATYLILRCLNTYPNAIYECWLLLSHISFCDASPPTQMLYMNVDYYCHISHSRCLNTYPNAIYECWLLLPHISFCDASPPTQMLYRNVDYYCHIFLSSMPQHLPKCYIGMLTITVTYFFHRCLTTYPNAI